jgi:hypothetical protein
VVRATAHPVRGAVKTSAETVPRPGADPREPVCHVHDRRYVAADRAGSPWVTDTGRPVSRPRSQPSRWMYERR